MEIFFTDQEGFALALLARETLDLSEQLHLEGLDYLLTLGVIHVNVDIDLFSRSEA